MFRSSLFALVFLFAASPVFAYLSPGEPSGYVNDFAGLLSAEARTELEGTLTQFAEASGGEIAVAIIQSLEGDDIESYANTLFREWGIGGKENDTGVLLLVSVEDRNVRIEVGYGYEGNIPDAHASRIIRDDIVPNFSEGQYDEGVFRAVNSLITLIREPGSAPPLEEASSFSLENFAVFGYLIFFLGSWIVSIMSRTKDWWLGGIFGALSAVLVGVFFGTNAALIGALPLIALGLLVDFAVSSAYRDARSSGHTPPWWTGGSSSWGTSTGGGFGGFGGGSSGGGGASGRW